MRPADGFAMWTVTGAPKPSSGAWLSVSVTASWTAYPFGSGGCGAALTVTVAGTGNAAAGQLAVATPSAVLTWPAGTGVGGGGGGAIPPTTALSTMLLSMLIVTPP